MSGATGLPAASGLRGAGGRGAVARGGLDADGAAHRPEAGADRLLRAGLAPGEGEQQAERGHRGEQGRAARGDERQGHADHGQQTGDHHHVHDGLAEQPADSLDLVLCNPPFHQQQVVGDFLAWRMFQQARAALMTGGELWIVGNRHLGYHAKLKRLFRGVEQVAATPKFVVLRATK